MGSNSKFRRASPEDRISNLPDSVLCHILSFLPTKFVVATSILSSRWKFLWASIPNLDFDDSIFFNHDIDCLNPRQRLSFMNFVDRVLDSRDNSINLEKFGLSCSGNCDLSLVRKWVCLVIGLNVKEIKLGLNLRGHFELPISLFRCHTLVVLRLNWKIFVDVPMVVSFLSLKVLHFNGVKFSCYESVEKILSGCPVLEELMIRKCRWDYGHTLRICGLALKNLILDWPSMVKGDHECGTVIDAPILEYLDVRDYISENFVIKNLCSLVKANLDVAQKFDQFVPVGVYGNCIIQFLKGVSAVKSLSLSHDTMGAIRYAYDYNFPTFHNLTMLELGASACSGWALLPDLLASSPILKNLVFVEGLFVYHHFQLGLSHFNWNPPVQLPACLLLHLKEIEIRNFRGVAEELMLAKYLLKNARVLRRMSIYCSFSEEDIQIHRKLLKFQRGSTACQLEFIF
ncbi:F-box/FBD/LRR-repeat protein [Actinidia chinensis var. chinensis]|uniref:F-box/FBD/LRR-repeat protein n=1 Tax=Actinidia chinensis var. chinensis TaxID=1590841 RepID=A0A2R6RPB8_ACTCC|nr:F-box/FBD/LRR-repeat protein [Actinidia chinensis var. chinensis]